VILPQVLRLSTVVPPSLIFPPLCSQTNLQADQLNFFPTSFRYGRLFLPASPFLRPLSSLGSTVLFAFMDGNRPRFFSSPRLVFLSRHRRCLRLFPRTSNLLFSCPAVHGAGMGRRIFLLPGSSSAFPPVNFQPAFPFRAPRADFVRAYGEKCNRIPPIGYFLGPRCSENWPSFLILAPRPLPKVSLESTLDRVLRFRGARLSASRSMLIC